MRQLETLVAALRASFARAGFRDSTSILADKLRTAPPDPLLGAPRVTVLGDDARQSSGYLWRWRDR